MRINCNSIAFIVALTISINAFMHVQARAQDEETPRYSVALREPVSVGDAWRLQAEIETVTEVARAVGEFGLYPGHIVHKQVVPRTASLAATVRCLEVDAQGTPTRQNVAIQQWSPSEDDEETAPLPAGTVLHLDYEGGILQSITNTSPDGQVPDLVESFFRSPFHSGRLTQQLRLGTSIEVGDAWEQHLPDRSLPLVDWNIGDERVAPERQTRTAKLVGRSIRQGGSRLCVEVLENAWGNLDDTTDDDVDVVSSRSQYRLFMEVLEDDNRQIPYRRESMEAVFVSEPTQEQLSDRWQQITWRQTMEVWTVPLED